MHSAPPTNWALPPLRLYPYEDRNSPHRLADEAYQIGEVGFPVRPYLSLDEMSAELNIPANPQQQRDGALISRGSLRDRGSRRST